MLFEGVVKTPGESPFGIIKDVLAKITPQLSDGDIDLAFRLHRQGTKGRPILVTFTKQAVKEEVLRKNANRQKFPSLKQVWISEDVNATVKKPPEKWVS